MVPVIDLNPDFHVVLRKMIALAFETAEVYQAAIDKLQAEAFKQKLAVFRNDCLFCIRELALVADAHGIKPSAEPEKTDALAEVTFSSELGDLAILAVLKTHEKEIKTAYERTLIHEGFFPEARNVINRVLSNKRQHQMWFEAVLADNDKQAA